MKRSSKILTIVVPVYNSKKFIAECIDSIIRNLPKVEIILVDDGSTDGSEVICDKYSNNFDDIRTIHTKNVGVSSARNLGLKLATGKYVWFIDSDDVILNGALISIVKAIIDNDFDIFVFSYVKGGSFETLEAPKNINIETKSKEEAIYTLLDPNFATFPWNKIFRKELLEENNISFPTEMVMCEDMEFCYKAFDKAKRVILTNDKLYGYRINEKGASYSKNKVRYKDAAIANYDLCTYIERNYPKYFDEIFSNTVVAIISYFYNYTACDDRYHAFSVFIKKHSSDFYKLNRKTKLEATIFLRSRYLFNVVGHMKSVLHR